MLKIQLAGEKLPFALPTKLIEGYAFGGESSPGFIFYVQNVHWECT